jgi:hypothetical protein
MIWGMLVKICGSLERDRLLFARFIGFAAALQALFFGLFWLQTRIRLPFSDMLRWIADYMRWREQGGIVNYLWAFHWDEHLVWIRILTAADVSAFGASGLPFVAVATSALLAATAMMLYEIRRSSVVAEPLAPLVWFVPMLMLTTANVVDCSVTINCEYPLALAFMVAALALLDGKPDRRRTTTFRRLAAHLAAIAAGFASAGGLLVWPALLWSAWRGAVGWRWLLAVALVGVGYIALYFYSLPAVTSLAAVFRSPPLSLAQVSRMADYFLAFLGLPLTRAPSLALIGRVVGGALFFAGAIAVLRFSTLRGSIARLDRIGVSLILVALGVAVAAAIARVDIEPEVKVPVRYTVFVTPLHIGLLYLIVPRLASRVHGTWLRAWMGVSSAAALALIVQQIAIGRAAVRTTGEITRTIERFYQGERSTDMRVVFPDLAEAARIVAKMRRAGLY